MMTTDIRSLRRAEFSRLDSENQVYLDYTGGGLYAESQLVEHLKFLRESVFGNPHSRSPASVRSTVAVEETRSRVLRFFNADEREFVVVFTSNATGALRLVGESYPFRHDSTYVLTADNHNSVNGIRAFALAKGSRVVYLPLNRDLRIPDIESLLPTAKDPHGLSGGANNLFAYPAQSNFSGVQHPLEWIDIARSKGYDVILDAAAYVPTNSLDLDAVKPDFVCISFYKMFGYPTGVGALIMRRAALGKLDRPWFAGGTVDLVTTKYIANIMSEGARRFEDGTLDYLEIPAVGIGLDFLENVGIGQVHAHVMALASILLKELRELKHSNGQPLARVYGPEGTERRGATVAFNLLTPLGTVIDPRIVGEQALKDNISIRTGCFCNPGAGEYALGYSAGREESCYHRLSPARHFAAKEYVKCMGGRATPGAVRVSLGVASNEGDIRRLVGLLGTFKDISSAQIGLMQLPELTC